MKTKPLLNAEELDRYRAHRDAQDFEYYQELDDMDCTPATRQQCIAGIVCLLLAVATVVHYYL